jgi:hypothetical protein
MGTAGRREEQKEKHRLQRANHGLFTYLKENGFKKDEIYAFKFMALGDEKVGTIINPETGEPLSLSEDAKSLLADWVKGRGNAPGPLFSRWANAGSNRRREDSAPRLIYKKPSD